MSERLLFLTGRLAESAPREGRCTGMAPTRVRLGVVNVGVKVAALMTEPILMRRLPRPLRADRVVVPGPLPRGPRAPGAGIRRPFERGPDELKDLPAFLRQGGRGARSVTPCAAHLRRDRRCVAAEPRGDCRARRTACARQGADVIDLGCLPDTPFPAPRGRGARIEGAGISRQRQFGRPGRTAPGRRGPAPTICSALTERNLAIAEETGARPVLIPAPARRSRLALSRRRRGAEAGRRAILDPVLDPIHFGFAKSLSRYREVRARAARRRDADGHRQPHGIDRRRFGRRRPRCCSGSARSSASPMCSSSM